MKNLLQATPKLLLVATALAACTNSEPVDLGDDVPAGRIGEKLSDYAGAWAGYAEAYTFDDGTDAVRLLLDEEGNGTLEVGEAPDLPPPDPESSYPPGADDYYVAIEGTFAPVAGFDYPVANAMVESRRIRFTTSTHELLREWCALQTPHEVLNSDQPGDYACAPTRSWGSDGENCFVGLNDEVEVDCGKLLCLTHCTCTETECGLAHDAQNVEFDAALESEGEELTGTMVVDGARVVVRMTRL